MAPKKAKETDSSAARFKFPNLLNQLGCLILQLTCNFYLLLVRCTGEGIYTLLHALFGVIGEVLRILLVLAARVLSEICYGVALIIEKIISAILQLLLLLIVNGGRFIDQATRGLVDMAGYGVSSVVFITITVFIWWLIVPVFEEVCHAIINLF